MWTAGMAGTIGTTTGFSVAGGGLGLSLGGLISLPWIVALAVVIWRFGGWIALHPIQFAVVGPVVVVASYAIFAGAFLDAVAISCVASSLCYLVLTSWRRLKFVGRDKA